VGFVEVVFVLDVADDLFEHVFDGDQAGDAAVFIDDDGHVIARDAEFAEQHVEALRFGDEDGRTQPVAQVEFGFNLDAQQVLGEQHAEHLVSIAIDHRKARVGGFDDDGNDFAQRVVDVDDIHLGPGNHHIGHAGVGGGERAFDDSQRIGVHQVALVGAVQDF